MIDYVNINSLREKTTSLRDITQKPLIIVAAKGRKSVENGEKMGQSGRTNKRTKKMDFQGSHSFYESRF